MTIATILKEKNANKDILLADYNLRNKRLPVGLIVLKGELIDSVLIDALKILPANFIISGKNDNYDNNPNIAFLDTDFKNTGFDFIVCDECENNITEYMKKGSVPIISANHTVSKLLSEFDAAKIQGNAFILENTALCDIYYAIIRYTENFKFPYDNKALVKNVLDI